MKIVYAYKKKCVRKSVYVYVCIYTCIYADLSVHTHTHKNTVLTPAQVKILTPQKLQSSIIIYGG